MTLAALLATSTVRADATDAREFYERGVYAYNLQHWDDALGRFEAAYSALPDPTFLFNIAQCQRQLGRWAAAAHSYRAYLAQVPAGVDRATAERLAAEMDAEAARQRPKPEPPAPAAPHLRAVVAAPAPSAARRFAAGLTLAGIGMGAAIAGAVLVGVGEADYAAARAAHTLPEQRQLWADGGRLDVSGIVTLAAGGVAVGVGGILLARRR